MGAIRILRIDDIDGDPVPPRQCVTVRRDIVRLYTGSIQYGPIRPLPRLPLFDVSYRLHRFNLTAIVGHTQTVGQIVPLTIAEKHSGKVMPTEKAATIYRAPIAKNLVFPAH
jgi:hypothetical protein